MAENADSHQSAAEDNERLRSALSTAREEGRLEGLEEAAKYVDESGSRNADASNTLYAEGNRNAARLSSFVSRSLYDVATAIRALKEKQG